jgi:hypothetical protein
MKTVFFEYQTTNKHTAGGKVRKTVRKRPDEAYNPREFDGSTDAEDA